MLKAYAELVYPNDHAIDDLREGQKIQLGTRGRCRPIGFRPSEPGASGPTVPFDQVMANPDNSDGFVLLVAAPDVAAPRAARIKASAEVIREAVRVAHMLIRAELRKAGKNAPAKDILAALAKARIEADPKTFSKAKRNVEARLGWSRHPLVWPRKVHCSTVTSPRPIRTTTMI
jgi:hypothetical protein